MQATIDLGPALKDILRRVEAFEASPSVPRTGTGARQEGRKFESNVREMWTAFCRTARDMGAQSAVVRAGKNRYYARLQVDDRCLWIPVPRHGVASDCEARWLEVDFIVEQLVESYPGTAEAVERYAPSAGDFAGCGYPLMYKGLVTKFDDTVLLTEDGTLIEKILLEYKTAKASQGKKIDGNVHERLTFQIMQYLEVATRYTRCSFVVIANGAFARYRNKYHVCFNVQADRLRNFAWFKMEYACTCPEYSRFLESLLSWLFYRSKRSWS